MKSAQVVDVAFYFSVPEQANSHLREREFEAATGEREREIAQNNISHITHHTSHTARERIVESCGSFAEEEVKRRSDRSEDVTHSFQRTFFFLLLFLST